MFRIQEVEVVAREELDIEGGGLFEVRRVGLMEGMEERKGWRLLR